MSAPRPTSGSAPPTSSDRTQSDGFIPVAILPREYFCPAELPLRGRGARPDDVRLWDLGLSQPRRLHSQPAFLDRQRVIEINLPRRNARSSVGRKSQMPGAAIIGIINGVRTFAKKESSILPASENPQLRIEDYSSMTHSTIWHCRLLTSPGNTVFG